jgi:hypothetical protein
MRFLESWWQHIPWFVRITLTVVTLTAMVLGGAADHYWT